MPLGAGRGFFSFFGALGFGVVVAAPSSFLGRPRPFFAGSASAPGALSLSAAAVVAAAVFLAAGAFFLFAAAVGSAPGTFFGRPRPTLAFLGGSSSASSSAERLSPALGASASWVGSSSSLAPVGSTAVSSSFIFSGTSVEGFSPPFSNDPVRKRKTRQTR